MKKKKVDVGQFVGDTKNPEGASEEFLEKTAPLIGYIVHSFNSLEQLLNDTICQLFHDDMDFMGLIVIHKLNYSAKVDLFKRFLIEQQTMMGMELPVFDSLVKNLEKAGELRNQVIHADWESAHADGYTLCKLVINTKNGFQQEYIQFTPEALEEILQLIDETYSMFEKYEEERETAYANY